MKLTQQHYPTIEIDNREPDIIQIWQNGKEDSNVIQIEREKYFEFMEGMIKSFDEDLKRRFRKDLVKVVDEPFVSVPKNRLKSLIKLFDFRKA